MVLYLIKRHFVGLLPRREDGSEYIVRFRNVILYLAGWLDIYGACKNEIFAMDYNFQSIQINLVKLVTIIYIYLFIYLSIYLFIHLLYLLFLQRQSKGCERNSGETSGTRRLGQKIINIQLTMNLWYTW